MDNSNKEDVNVEQNIEVEPTSKQENPVQVEQQQEKPVKVDKRKLMTPQREEHMKKMRDLSAQKRKERKVKQSEVVKEVPSVKCEDPELKAKRKAEKRLSLIEDVKKVILAEPQFQFPAKPVQIEQPIPPPTFVPQQQAPIRRLW